MLLYDKNVQMWNTLAAGTHHGAVLLAGPIVLLHSMICHWHHVIRLSVSLSVTLYIVAPRVGVLCRGLKVVPAGS